MSVYSSNGVDEIHDKVVEELAPDTDLFRRRMWEFARKHAPGATIKEVEDLIEHVDKNYKLSACKVGKFFRQRDINYGK